MPKPAKDTRLQRALELHQRGNLLDAEKLYDALLAEAPGHVEAAALLGTIRIQQGRYRDGVALLENVVQAEPNHAPATANLGLAYHELGELDKAIAFYRRAIEIDGGSDQSVNNLACALRESGQLAEAELLLRRKIDSGSQFARLYYNLGLVQKMRGELDAAIASFRAAIERQANYADAYVNLGNVLCEAGQPETALAMLDKAIAIAPHMHDAWGGRGLALSRLNRAEEAVASHRRAVQLAPGVAATHINLGAALDQLGERQQALDEFHRALELQPTSAAACVNIARVLTECGKADEALPYCERALRLDGGLFLAHLNRGAALVELGRDNDARDEFEWCRRRDPEDPNLLVNLGTLASYRGNTKEALAYFEQAAQRSPNDALTQWNVALAQLASGHLDEGWKNYHWGLRTPYRYQKVAYSLPRWQGQDIRDKTLLIRAEQGVGDEVQLASCLRDAQQRAARVIVQCDPRLVGLYRRSFPELIIHGGPRDEAPDWLTAEGGADVQIELGSLLPLLRPRFEEFEGKSPYLKPDPARVAYWRERLAQLGSQPKVGLAWRSRLSSQWRARHYPAIEDLVPILQTPGVIFVNLQYDDCRNELAEIRTRTGASVHTFDELDLMNNLDDSAALMQALDLVIAPTTSTLVLGAAVGAACWQMRSRAMSAWTFGQKHHVWFPTVKVYQQQDLSVWRDVTSAIASDLRIWSSERLPPPGVRAQPMLANDTTASRSEAVPHAPDAAVVSSGLIPLVATKGASVVTVGATENVVAAFRAAVGSGGRVVQQGPYGIDKLGLARLDAVWISAGQDVAATLLGAQHALTQWRPMIVVDDKRVGSSDEVAGVLHALGYQHFSPADTDASMGGGLLYCPIPMPTQQSPSARHMQLIEFYRKMHAIGAQRAIAGKIVDAASQETFPGQELPMFARPIGQLIRQYGASNVLDYGAGKGKHYDQPITIDGARFESLRDYWGGVAIESYEPALPGAALAPSALYDGVVCTDVLEHVSEMDVPWVVNELFARARHFVFVSIACSEAYALLPDGTNAHCTVHPPAWWRGVLRVAAVRYPRVRYVAAFWLPQHNDRPDNLIWFDSAAAADTQQGRV